MSSRMTEALDLDAKRTSIAPESKSSSGLVSSKPFGLRVPMAMGNFILNVLMLNSTCQMDYTYLHLQCDATRDQINKIKKMASILNER